MSIRDDSIAILQKENNRLTHENEEIKEQMRKLKDQFDKAVSISDALEESYSKNKSLSKSLLDLEAEKEDLSRRLKISLQASDSLKSQIIQLQSSIRQPLPSRPPPPPPSNLSEISDLKSKISSLETHISKQSDEISKKNSEIQTIFAALSAFFKEPVNSGQQIFEKLSNFSIPSTDEFEKLAKKSHKYKEKLQMLKLQQGDSVEALRAQLQDATKQGLCQSQKLNELAEANSRLAEEIAQLKTSLRIEQLKCKEEPKEDIEQKPADSSAELLQLREENSSLHEKFIKSIKAVKALERRADALKEALKSKKKETFSLKIEAKRLSSENSGIKEKMSSLLQKKRDYKMKLTQAESQLQKMETSVESRSNEAEMHKSASLKASSEVERLRTEISSVKSESAVLNETIGHQRETITSLQEKLTAAIKNGQNLEKQLSDCQTKAMMKPSNPSELIPIAVWSCSDLPRELGEVVNEIAGNPSFQFPTKIRSVLSAVAKWYTSRSERIEKEAKELKESCDTLKSMSAILTNFLGRQFPECRIDFSTLLSDERSRDALSQIIAREKNEIDEMKKYKAQCEDFLFSIFSILNADSASSAIEKAKYLRDAEAKERSKLKLLKNTVKDLKTVLRNEEASYAEEKSGMEQKIAAADEEVKGLEGKISEILSDGEKKSEELQTKVIEIEQLNKAASETEKEKNDLKAKIKANEEEILKISALLQKSKEDCAHLNEEISRVEAEAKQRIGEKNIETEKIVADVAEKAKSQSAEYSSKITDLNAAISALNSKCGSLQTENATLQLKIQKLEMKYNASEAEHSRAKSAIESQAKTRMMAAESEMKAQIEATRAKAENDRITFESTVSQAFTPLLRYDEPTPRKIDELISVVRQRFEALKGQEARISSILRPSDGQSLEQAAAEAVSRSSMRKRE